MLKNILVVFFAVNALFWGLFPHSTHCQVASLITNTCLPHTVHVSIGVMSFFVAIVIAQNKMLNKIFA